MLTPDARPAARYSSFAAAFLSFLLPGLGQLYCRRVLRALVWMVPWLLAVALIAGAAFSMGLKRFGEQFLDTAWLRYLLAGVAIDLVWRLLSVVDAWWVARAPAGVRDGSLRRTGSVVGLAAILAVLLVTHAAVARPVYRAYDTAVCLDPAAGCDDPDDPGSETPEPDESQLPEASLPTVGSADPNATPTPEPTDPPAGLDGERLNILLVGTNGKLTDTMIVVSIDRQTGQVAFIGMPRDTIGLPIPKEWAAYRAFPSGIWPLRANQIFNEARDHPDLFPGKNDRARGYNALKGILSETLGLDIPYYVRVDMDGFMDAVNALGGAMIDVQLPLYDSRYNSADGRGTLKLYMAPGFHFMDGGDALAYARSRHASSDIDRSARQTRVITAIRNQLDISTILQPGGFDRYLDLIGKNVKTDIPPKLFPDLAQLVQGIDLDKRVSLQLGGRFSEKCDDRPSAVCDAYSLNRPYGLEADVTRMRRAVRDLFEDPEAVQRQQDIAAEEAVVQVLNGTKGTNQRATRLADELVCEGVDASVPPVNGGRADRDDYPESVITVYNGAATSMPETIDAIEKLLGVSATEANDPAQTANVVVVVGKGAPTVRPSCNA